MSSPKTGRPSTFVEVTGSAIPDLGFADRLADALISEAGLLGELATIMRRQRAAVASDDLESVDEAVFATHRVLATLAEARHRRRSIARLLGESDDLSLAALELFFNGSPPAVVQAATDRLSDAARTLQREVARNQRVLRHALEASDRYVRALCGMPAPGPIGYPDGPGAASGSNGGSGTKGGNIVNRMV